MKQVGRSSIVPVKAIFSKEKQPRFYSMRNSVGKLNGHFSLVLGGEAQRGNGAGGGLFEIFDELAGRND